MTEEIFGIDLGTTNSCVALINPANNQPEVIANQRNFQTTPSVVFYDEYDTPIVGDDAKHAMRSDPRRAVAFIKREMSHKHYQRSIGEEEITPVKISALILKKLVDDANIAREYEGKAPIHKAVITVPAYFGNDERELTRQAAEIAGIECVGLLNEPTAAALCYGKNALEGKTIMIYDLGGGTFDVSIIRMRNGEIETLSTDGNHELGGVDWDECIVNYALMKTPAADGLSYKDIEDQKEGGEMILAAEQCKKMLTSSDKAPMRFRFKGKPSNIEVKRDLFEEFGEELMDKTILCVRHAIDLAPSDTKIDEIILVGGSSRMPMVKKRLMKEFPDIHIRLDQFEPDLAVAKGAAIYAADQSKIEDKASRSYGILTRTGITNILLRTDPMVYYGESLFETAYDDQESALIQIYENSSAEKEIPENQGTPLLKKELTWGGPVAKGTFVTARVKREKDGIVTIEMECLGHKVEIRIEPQNMLPQEEVKKLKTAFKKIEL